MANRPFFIPSSNKEILVETKTVEFKWFSGFMISTSANISGQKNINDPQDILDIFEYDELAYYDESLGENKTPSQIIDLETKRIIRA